VKTISKQEQRTKIEEETYLALKKENQKLLSKLQDYRNALDLNKKKHQKLLLDYDSLNTEHKLLKGKNQQLMEYLDALGTNLENIPLI
jgi:chromosome segregation ATPase